MSWCLEYRRRSSTSWAPYGAYLNRRDPHFDSLLNDATVSRPLMPMGALPAEENGTYLRSASAVFSACVKDR